MKRSEFENILLKRHFLPDEEWIRAAITAAQEAGVQWDPEEVELPKEVRVLDGACALWWDGRAHIEERANLSAVYQEAAARYNAVTKIIQKVATPHSPHQLLREVLAAEVEKQRGKLQCAKT